MLRINLRRTIQTLIAGVACVAASGHVHCVAQESAAHKSGCTDLCHSDGTGGSGVRVQLFSRYSPMPTGDLIGRISYQGMNIYYYDRPYSPVHVSESFNRHTESSDGLFRSVYDSVEHRAMLDKNEDAVVIDRAFEFTDWPKFQSARLSWETGTRPDSSSGN